MASSETTNADPAPQVVLLHEKDNVGVAIVPLRSGQSVEAGGQSIEIERDVDLGAKIAVRPIATGETVYKWGAPIGSATRDIAPGGHVHTHNIKSDYLPTYARGDARGAMQGRQ